MRVIFENGVRYVAMAINYIGSFLKKFRKCPYKIRRFHKKWTKYNKANKDEKKENEKRKKGRKKQIL